MKEVIQKQENNPEKFKEIELKIKEADGIHQLEIIFDETDVKLVMVYNAAINEICNKQNKFGVFHQTGGGNEAGYHAWEFLGSSPGINEVQDLIGAIHKKAAEEYKKFKEMELF